MSDDRTYYARRAAEHRALAERAANDDARRRHLELAELMRARTAA